MDEVSDGDEDEFFEDTPVYDEKASFPSMNISRPLLKVLPGVRIRSDLLIFGLPDPDPTCDIGYILYFLNLYIIHIYLNIVLNIFIYFFLYFMPT